MNYLRGDAGAAEAEPAGLLQQLKKSC